MSCFDSIISFESDIFQTSSYLICSWADEDKRRGVELVWEVLFEYGMGRSITRYPWEIKVIREVITLFGIRDEK